MRQDPYKKRKFEEWLIPRLIGAGIIIVIILIVIMITTMYQGEQLYYEGMIKSIPMLNNEKVKILGDTYIELNKEFEQEIKELELNYANRLNKRGDKIHYGVNGKENSDMMINDDYVNGIESIKYIKGKSENRPDGDSNFIDMITFLSVALGSDIDRYTEEELKDIFTDLFKLTHTFSGNSTELYPCEHGCGFCKYYCGDVRVQGSYGGDIVGFYQCDEYMGQSGEYGLMYNPFLISKRKNYQELIELAENETKMKTTYQYKDLKITTTYSEGMVNESHTIVTKGDTVVSGDDEIFLLNEPDGYCYVCSGGNNTFTQTTRKYGGCNSHVVCHCRDAVSTKKFRDEEDTIGYWVDWCMGEDSGKCGNYSVHEAECTHDCECEGDCTHECADPILLDSGYYVCEGHNHYACPGHIIVCCFGHTNLNLEIKIMYYQDMIDSIYNSFE